MLTAFLAVLEISPWGLIRVDIPDHPDAITTSATGSVLLAPPSAGPYRVEAVPEIDLATGLMGDSSDWAAGDAAGDSWQATEALDAMAATPWQAAGFDGSGVKVAVFDLQWFGADLYPALDEIGAVSTHDCFAHPSCALPIDSSDARFGFEGGAHGVACAQVIADIAPGADLYLVRVNTLTTLENAVSWSIREGIDVVSMSMSFFNEGFYDGTGAVNDQMDRLAAAGVLMVTSAGNYAEEHYNAEFRDIDGDGLHDFPWGSPYLPVRYSVGSKRINLIWDDFTNCGDSDLDIYAYASNGDLIGRATALQERDGETCSPVERLDASVPEDGWIYLSIHHAGGSPNTRFDLLARGGSVWQAQAKGSVTDPGTHAAVLTVGAVRATPTYAVNPPESFSSHGPTLAGLPKPELAAPDGLTTSIYGPGNFYGTSAATPATAGAIALWMSADPRLSAQDVAASLVASARNDRSVGARADSGLGAGRLRMPPPSTQPRGCGGALGALLFLPALGLGRRRR